MCVGLSIMTVLTVASSGTTLAQNDNTIRLTRLNHLSVEHLEGDLAKEVQTEILSRIVDPEELIRTREQFKRSEFLDTAWADVERSNELWRTDQRYKAQYNWLRSTILHWNTDASFASLINLGTSMDEIGNLDGAMIAYGAVLALPTPMFRQSNYLNVEDYRHSACLALSDLTLEACNYHASLVYIDLAIGTYRADNSCGLFYRAHILMLHDRIKAIKQAEILRAKVEWAK